MSVDRAAAVALFHRFVAYLDTWVDVCNLCIAQVPYNEGPGLTMFEPRLCAAPISLEECRIRTGDF
jgi:hypothetical protein